MAAGSGEPHETEAVLVGEEEYRAPPREEGQSQTKTGHDGAVGRPEDQVPEQPIDINLLEAQKQKPGLQISETIVVDPREKKVNDQTMLGLNIIAVMTPTCVTVGDEREFGDRRRRRLGRQRRFGRKCRDQNRVTRDCCCTRTSSLCVERKRRGECHDRAHEPCGGAESIVESHANRMRAGRSSAYPATAIAADVGTLGTFRRNSLRSSNRLTPICTITVTTDRIHS